MQPKTRFLFILRTCATATLFFTIIFTQVASAQQSDRQSDLQRILERLDRIEQENQNLAAEVRALRQQLAARDMPPPSPDGQPAPIPPSEVGSLQEQRINELAQTKVEASQKFPVKLSGMVLFNAYLNGQDNGGAQTPLMAGGTDPGTGNPGGGSFNQSLINLSFNGPRIWGGGKVNGSLNMDLFGGSTSSLNHLLRLRTAGVTIDWKNQSFMVGQDKPIVSPREPTSLAQIAYTPLSGAGNPWLWQPQARFEQRFAFGESTGLRAQVGVYQTSEPIGNGGKTYQNFVGTARPSLQGRFELWRNLGHGARIEIAPGFHTSQTHVAGFSIPSRLFTIDWLIQPVAKLKWTGLFFTGENNGGMGGLQQGFISRNKTFIGIPTTGGWTQLSYEASGRLTFNLYGGQESYQPGTLLRYMVNRNLLYAGNAIYRLGPNVLLGAEVSQARTKYYQFPSVLVNHFDLALAYLF